MPTPRYHVRKSAPGAWDVRDRADPQAPVARLATRSDARLYAAEQNIRTGGERQVLNALSSALKQDTDSSNEPAGGVLIPSSC